MSQTLLEIKDLHVHYGAIHAIKGISFQIQKGQIVTILGANGAGKTTTLRTISALIGPTQGQITFNGEEIQNEKAYKLVAKGICHSPEGRLVFPDLTVAENLEMGAYLRRDKEQINKDQKFVFDLFPRLFERKKQLAGTLSGGEQQMLAIGRAIMGSPKLLLLDEPSLGIAPILVQSIFRAITNINQERGVTVLLVEQNAYAALKIAHYGHVMETGMINISGDSKELLSNKAIAEAYLGGH